MRLSLYRIDPPRQPETVACEPSAPSVPKPAQSAQLSESDRQALHRWAAKHGFVLRNPADEWLAEAAWRRDLDA